MRNCGEIHIRVSSGTPLYPAIMHLVMKFSYSSLCTSFFKVRYSLLYALVL